MTGDTIEELYSVILDRKANPSENSYTCYLFGKGLDKILKKVGEESAETIIAAKNGKNEETTGEISDLIYHLLVMMAELGIKPGDVSAVLDGRAEKIGNLKKFHTSDHNT
jgi:phosphoribosyl-ATP pyrophosphohydrolase